MTFDTPIRRLLVLAGLALGLLPSAKAQWLTQSFLLKPGWRTLVEATSPISVISLWEPKSTEGRIVREPAQYTGSDFISWSKATGPTNAFLIRANTAYLVQNAGPSDYVWKVKGKPVPPAIRWTATGLNLIGFSTPTNTAPKFSNLLSPAPAWNQFLLYHYPGGEAPGAPPRPTTRSSLDGTEALRGRAVWIKKRDNSDNRYYGPFEYVLQDYRDVVFSESDGLAWVLGNSDGELWRSPDGGTTWSRRFGRANTVWRGIAASGDGQRWFAAPHDGPIHASSDAGMTWQALVGSTAGRWQSVACSTNGSVVVAVENPGGIHRSIDAGVTWDSLDSAPSPVAWASIVCSSDGSALVAAPEAGPLSVSTDGGKTWNLREANRRWAGVATSADGTRWIAGALGETAPVLTTQGRFVLNRISSIGTLQ